MRPTPIKIDTSAVQLMHRAIKGEAQLPDKCLFQAKQAKASAVKSLKIEDIDF